MHKFKIIYIDSHDLQNTTTVYADTVEEATRRIIDIKTVVKIKDRGKIFTPPAIFARLFKATRLSHRELADTLRQLAYTERAGVSTITSLTMLASAGTSKQIVFCNSVLKKMQQGSSLADAIGDSEYMLPIKISAIIRASSESGSLSNILLTLADQIEANLKITDKVKTALIYPVTVLIIAIAVTWFLFTSIIPQVAEVITGIGNASLPAMTLQILAIGEYMRDNGVIILITLITFLIVGNFLLNRFKASAKSRVALAVPYVGKIIYAGEMSKFYSHFSFLLQAGFVTADAVRAASDVINNTYLCHRLCKALTALEKGYAITEALRASGIARTLDLQLINTGAASGQLIEICRTLSEQLADEADRRTQNLLKIMEPAIMIFVGVIVGVVMLAIYQPLFELMTVF